MPTTARVAYAPPHDTQLRVEETQLPDPGPDQVVVREFASGVCHSQLHQIREPRDSGRLLGHEATGVVLAMGSRVSHVKEGDHVIVTWVPRNPEQADRKPEPITLTFADGGSASTPLTFTWADHTLADQQYVVPIPDHLPTDVTCVIGCAVITGAGAVTQTAAVPAGESVAIFGVGGVGLCAVAAAKFVGADPIIAVDLSEEKLEFARQFGATVGIDASREDPVERIHELTRHPGKVNIYGGAVDGVDYAFDCIGARVTMEQIVPAVRGAVLGASTGGTAVLVGVPRTPIELDPLDMVFNEKKFIASMGGSSRPERDFATYIRWFLEGDLDLEALVTQRYRLDQINEATEALRRGEVAGRAIIEF